VEKRKNQRMGYSVGDNLQILCREMLGANSKLVLEAGSGTGWGSLKLRKDKNVNVMLLDVSRTAIRISKSSFKEQG
jgi:methylase of polypeptide subunit release factors